MQCAVHCQFRETSDRTYVRMSLLECITCTLTRFTARQATLPAVGIVTGAPQAGALSGPSTTPSRAQAAPRKGARRGGAQCQWLALLSPRPPSAPRRATPAPRPSRAAPAREALPCVSALRTPWAVVAPLALDALPSPSWCTPAVAGTSDQLRQPKTRAPGRWSGRRRRANRIWAPRTKKRGQRSLSSVVAPPAEHPSALAGFRSAKHTQVAPPSPHRGRRNARVARRNPPFWCFPSRCTVFCAFWRRVMFVTLTLPLLLGFL